MNDKYMYSLIAVFVLALLAYVGVTRARDFLTISWSQTRMKWGKRRESLCSRFVAEMQEQPT